MPTWLTLTKFLDSSKNLASVKKVQCVVLMEPLILLTYHTISINNHLLGVNFLFRFTEFEFVICVQGLAA